jgi:hypothetical protein
MDGLTTDYDGNLMTCNMKKYSENESS